MFGSLTPAAQQQGPPAPMLGHLSYGDLARLILKAPYMAPIVHARDDYRARFGPHEAQFAQLLGQMGAASQRAPV